MTSVQSSVDSNLSCWNASKDNYKYSFGKSISEEKSMSDLKIHSINIYVFNGKNNQRLEVHARTYDLETYFKIIDVAQNYFSDNNKYYFNSTYDHFPKDRDGLCTVESVKYRQTQWKNGLSERTHLESSLAYHSRYETKEELSKQLSDALNILKGADSTVGEITGHLESLLKV